MTLYFWHRNGAVVNILLLTTCIQVSATSSSLRDWGIHYLWAHLHHCLALKWLFSRQHLPEDEAKAVDICSRGHALPAQHLWSHPGRGSFQATQVDFLAALHNGLLRTYNGWYDISLATRISLVACFVKWQIQFGVLKCPNLSESPKYEMILKTSTKQLK